MQESLGAKIKKDSEAEIAMTDCDACAQAKLRRQVRRTERIRPSKPGIRIAIDFHDFEKTTYSNNSMMIATDRYSGYTWDHFFKNRQTESVIAALERLIKHLWNRYQVKVEVIKCDNEILKHEDGLEALRDTFPDHEITFEPSAANTQGQNGAAERSGGVIKDKARAMRLGLNLPKSLWPEIMKAAIYLYNRSPKHIYNWKTPYERFHTYFMLRDGLIGDRKPKQAHLKAYGCKAYTLDSSSQLKKDRLDRLDPKAWIGYLVGYDSTNIYRIWNPLNNRIESTRDVQFQEKSFYTGNPEDLQKDAKELLPETIEALLARRDAQETQPETINEYPELDHEVYQNVAEDDLEETGDPESKESVEKDRATGSEVTCEPDQLYTQAIFVPYPSPLGSSSPSSLFTATIREADLVVRPAEAALVAGKPRFEIKEDPFNLYTVVSARESCWEATFNSGRLCTAESFHGMPVSKAKKARMVNHPICHPDPLKKSSAGNAASDARKDLESRNYKNIKQRLLTKKVHRTELPPLPKTHKDLDTHPVGEGFRAAERLHLESHKEMALWSEVDQRIAYGKLTLDCMWVYVYKFNKHGYFMKCKARLVVRGDQQPYSSLEETYASTLAGRSFRTLMAIAAKFDLELKQYDAVNAFVNAKLDKEIYIKMPPGYRKSGTVLRLQKALYGLRESPLLWQKELTSTLSRLGYLAVPHEPCCYSKDGILVFIYVDDIVLAYQSHKEVSAMRLIRELKTKYQLTGGDDLQWFLGVKVIRDRQQKLIWLSQSSYIEKISKLSNSKEKKHPTPMKIQELLPYRGLATAKEIHAYQKKIGSIMYAAVITRPDIAFPASRLSRFNLNPSPEHHREADRTLDYLLQTQYYALELGGGDGLIVASDSSFADNTIDRKSSQAYVMKLFGGVIGWRANKQDTVTTSTTEAELLALAQAAKEAMFVSRLIKELGVTLDSQQITLQCDNQQTIGLLKKEVSTLKTKLRHVDIHNHWLRQEVQRETLDVTYVPTGDMIADGLTKALPATKWAGFMTQLRLKDVKARILERKQKEITQEDLDSLEDGLSGGEVEAWRPRN
ncbi:hypothetical protein NPX13_g10642 [Xylaria arbuscula]|uniref:Integrase catalytic domain-containing protein n=1 Tax=Xylaria arbuscula TaxID=114810 RepID=A0A9W8N4E6_9PEZI|nr:hypothetical protein NPX13_g10642 [Xylaria arbuscula]